MTFNSPKFSPTTILLYIRYYPRYLQINLDFSPNIFVSSNYYYSVILYMRLLKPVDLPMLFILTFPKRLIRYHIMNCSVNYTLFKISGNCGDGSTSTYSLDSSMRRSIIKHQTFFWSAQYLGTTSFYYVCQ